MSILSKFVTVGLFTALIGALVSATPIGWSLEERIGLAWLFNARGPRPAPSNVIVVTTDRKSAADLGLPQEPWKWPRSLHGQLIQRLADKGARVIAFDMFFKDAGLPEEDQAFARAIQDAGNVILIEKMTRVDQPPSAVGMNMHLRVSPTAKLASASAGLAPNPLPAVPFRVNQFWLFEPSDEHVATFPFLAFNLYGAAAYEDLATLLERVQPELARQFRALNIAEPGNLQSLSQDLRNMIERHPGLADRLDTMLQAEQPGLSADWNSLLTSLLSAYRQGHSQYLDFYGPPRTITTVPYSCILNLCSPEASSLTNQNPEIDFSDAAVFVGLSEQIESEQQDRFHTVYTSESGLYISGVEISATAFANLLEHRQVMPLTLRHHLLLVIFWGIGISLTLRALSPTYLRTGIGFGIVLLATSMGAGAAYFGAAYYLFAREAVWLPVVVPLLIQLPLSVGATLFSRYWEAHKTRHNIQTALAHYVPGPIADQLAQNIEDFKTKGQVLEGICLATDAEHYTALAESFEPQELRVFMNRYYEVVFEPVRRRQGIVSDVIGDAVLAIWTTSAWNAEQRINVCDAALDIANAVEQFNRRHQGAALHTRIGLHGGTMWLGHVGAGDHYEYRAVGDIVNTASRIEGLNKHLGTHILASEIVVDGADTFLIRELGSFLLAGKSQPMAIHEILGRLSECETALVQSSETFANALHAFRQQQWKEAERMFQTCITMFGDDGPSRYYLGLCHHYRNTPPPADWTGVIRIDKK